MAEALDSVLDRLYDKSENEGNKAEAKPLDSVLDRLYDKSGNSGNGANDPQKDVLDKLYDLGGYGENTVANDGSIRKFLAALGLERFEHRLLDLASLTGTSTELVECLGYMLAEDEKVLRNVLGDVGMNGEETAKMVAMISPLMGKSRTHITATAAMAVEERLDPKTGHTYYYNPTTQKSGWTREEVTELAAGAAVEVPDYFRAASEAHASKSSMVPGAGAPSTANPPPPIYDPPSPPTVTLAELNPADIERLAEEAALKFMTPDPAGGAPANSKDDIGEMKRLAVLRERELAERREEEESVIPRTLAEKEVAEKEIAEKDAMVRAALDGGSVEGAGEGVTFGKRGSMAAAMATLDIEKAKKCSVDCSKKSFVDCSVFRLDVVADAFGVCQCGAKRVEHSASALLASRGGEGASVQKKATVEGGSTGGSTEGSAEGVAESAEYDAAMLAEAFMTGAEANIGEGAGAAAGTLQELLVQLGLEQHTTLVVKTCALQTDLTDLVELRYVKCSMINAV
jgi:hypothetical protein